MSYYADLYVKFYALLCSAGSWGFYLILYTILWFIVSIVQTSKNPHKKQMLYWCATSMIITFIIKVLAWLLLPSPKFLGWL